MNLHKAPIIALLLAACAGRFVALDHRPMHADEGVMADKFGVFLATGSYAYDPREYHGPALAYLTWIPARLTGRMDYASLDERTLRVVPAVAGVLLALAPLLLAGLIGRPAALWASAFLAVSPAMVFYSRYFIPETLLALGTALLLTAILRGWWAVAGIASALMLVTKETAVLALVAAAASYVAVFRPALNRRTIAAAAIGAGVLAALAWMWSAYIARGASGSIHAHPWYSYLKWLAMTEAPILLAAAAAWKTAKAPVRFLLVFAVVLLACYSALPYKTPWCAVSPLYAIALLGGVAASRAQVLPAVAVACLAVTAWFANAPLAADTRNPWVYAHTTADVFTIRDRLAAVPRETAIDIYTSENLWPLPWYLRPFPNARWWTKVSPQGKAAPVVLLTPEAEPDLVHKLYEGPPPGERELYVNLFDRRVELRPQVEIRGYIAKSLADATASEK
jgi:Dolichyl-phosphate-mannose-protein mannosyltransferase